VKKGVKQEKDAERRGRSIIANDGSLVICRRAITIAV
jgi:hypothetical protein